jgi:hypothetical protein
MGIGAVWAILKTVWSVPALRWPALVLAGMLALFAYVEVTKWRAANDAVEKAEQETRDAMDDLTGAARDGRDAYMRCTRDGGLYDLRTGRCQAGNP